MKITMDGGITFEGTQAEYEAFLAFAERKAAEQEAPKVAVELTKGDSVKILGLSKYNANHIGQIGIVDGDAKVAGYVYVKVDGKNRIYDAKNLELVAKADETITFEGAEYRKVDREAREGDVVIFKDGVSPRDFITIGKPYRAVEDCKRICFKDNDGDYMTIYRNDSRNRTRETVDVYEPIAESKPQATKYYEPKVGDIVVVTGNTNASVNRIGDIGKVVEGPFNTGSYRVSVEGRKKRGNRTRPEDIRPATAEEIAQYEKAVADAVRADEEAKWAKLGRKVGEYKVGDIIEITVDQCGLAEGAISKVTRVDDYGVSYKGDGCIYGADYGHFKLIAPVESVLTQN